MRPVHLLGLLAMNVLWAGSYSAFKALSVRLTAGEIVTWRFGLAAGVLALAWRWLPGRAPRGSDLVRAGLMGLLVFVVGPRLQVLGVQLGRASDSSVVVALEPLVTAVAAAWFLRERVPAHRWAGFGLGMVGIVLLNGGWQLQLSGAGLWANLIFISSFVCESAYSVMGKPLLRRASPIKVVAVALFLGSAVNLAINGPGAASKLWTLTAVDWANLVFLAGVCTLIGYTFWLVVVRESDVSLAALTILVQPVFGVGIAAWLLGEQLHWGQFWGTMAILGGVVLGLGSLGFAWTRIRHGLGQAGVTLVDWQARVDAAERRAGEAEALARTGLLPHLARLLRAKLVVRLLRQRRDLIAGQEAGAQTAEALERRLASVQEDLRRKQGDPKPTAQTPTIPAPETPAAAPGPVAASRRNPLVQRRPVVAEPVSFNELLARRRHENTAANPKASPDSRQPGLGEV
jgi:drug/metabolite transporter (DMT)-like permease